MMTVICYTEFARKWIERGGGGGGKDIGSNESIHVHLRRAVPLGPQRENPTATVMH